MVSCNKFEYKVQHNNYSIINLWDKPLGSTINLAIYNAQLSILVVRLHKCCQSMYSNLILKEKSTYKHNLANNFLIEG